MKSLSLLLLFVFTVISFPTSAQDKENITTIIVLRHAEKINDPGNSDPSLSEKGLLRADRIAEMLSEEDIAAIYTTNYNRTKQTVAALAEEKGLSAIVYSPADENQFAEILKKHEGEKIVICGHSNTIPLLLNFFSSSEDYQELKEYEYDKLFLISRSSSGANDVIKLIVK